MRVFCALTGAFILTFAAIADAQTIVPPTVLVPADPNYAGVTDVTRDVDVIVTIESDGTASAATVITPENAVSDELAIETARRYTFTPASRDGKPVKSRIKLRIHLSAPAAAPAPVSDSVSVSVPIPVPVSVPVPVSDSASAPEEVHVAGERVTQSATRHSLDREELETIPGTGGDALRTIESLPGVARAPAFSGFIILRGSAPQDSQVFVDGASVPIAFHFAGLAAIVPTELIERLDVYPGNYEVAYGRGIGGIVDIGLRSPTHEGIHGVLKADLLDARALIEGALDSHTRVLVAARRSYIDTWFPIAADQLQLGITASPVYYDYQAILERDLGSRATLRASFMGSSDALSLTLPPGSSSDPSFSGAIQNTTVFWRGTVRAEGKTIHGSRWTLQGSFGRDSISLGVGSILSGHNDVYRAATRAQIEVPLSKHIRLLTGLDVEAGSYEFDLRFPPIPVTGEPDTGAFYSKQELTANHTFGFINPAAFASLDVRPLPRLQSVVGLRVETFGGVPTVARQPRMTLRYFATSDPKLTFKAAAGLYSQAPQVYENDPTFGTAGIHVNRSAQASLGMEIELFHRLNVSIEPFYKNLYDLVSRRPDASQTSGFRYGNEGTGFAYGAEFLIKLNSNTRKTTGWMGWLAYTISRSERRDLPEQSLRLFDYDQTHVFSALASDRLGNGWEVGVRARYVTGNPYTPVISGAFDADAGAYSPIEQRPLFSSRFPSFFSIDVRVEKKWQLGKTANVSLYLDVMNATNRRNIEGFTTNFDYSTTVPISGLPILPNLGLRGEL